MVDSTEFGSRFRRHALGLFAVTFLTAAGILAYRIGLNEVQESVSTSICLRVGLVLGAAWLAYPQLQQLGRQFPPWLIAATAFGMLLLLVQPKAFRFLLPVILILLALQMLGRFLQPRKR
jgi:hypothetical protein